MYKLAIIGNPIDHSLSPSVFQYFSKQFNINLTYDKITALNIDGFKKIIHTFFNNNGLALNITSPYKHEAFLSTQTHSSRSSFCKTSNFLYFNNNQIVADTTDGIGIITDIENNNHQTIKDKHILIIGSGFVLDSILLDFIAKNPYSISILARNNQRIHLLQNKFAINIHNTAKEYDIIINSSPNTLDNELFAKVTIIKDNTFCYDMAYSKTNTLFHQLMKKLNNKIITQNGLGMLVEQASVAFSHLFNKKPDTLDVINKIKTRIN